MKKSSAKKPKSILTQQLDAPSHQHLLVGWNQSNANAARSIGFGIPQNQDLTVPCAPEPSRQPIFANDTEGHLITVAATSRGKGRSALIPTLLTYPGSVVVIDPKGEALEVTGKRRKAMGQRLVVIDPFRISNFKRLDGLNIFDIQGNSDQSVEAFATEAAQLLHYGRSAAQNDPFWDIRADALNAAVIAVAASSPNPADRNLLWVRDLLMKGDPVLNMARLLDTSKNRLSSMAYAQIGSFLNTDEKCRSGILATAVQHFGNFFGPSVEDSLVETTFNLDAYAAGEPTSIYLVIPPQKLKSHGSLLRLWVGALLSVALSRQQRLPVSDLFCLDEAAQLGELEGFRSLMTLMRGYSVRCWSFWQDLSQLRQLYRHDWETMLNNAATIQIFGATNHLAAKALAELMGDHVQPHDLLKLPPNEQILVETSGKITQCQKLDYLVDPVFQGLYQPNPRYANLSHEGLGRN